MKADLDDIPEPDRVPGAPHPRHTDRVIGQDSAIADFMQAAQGGRLHHAWLLTGPRGVGKATLAWAIARWLLSGATGPFGAIDTPEAGMAVPDTPLVILAISCSSVMRSPMPMSRGPVPPPPFEP